MKYALPFIQSIRLDVYISAKARSKKDHGLPLHKSGEGLTPDEQLVHFLLANSSITDHAPDSPRNFRNVSDAIHTMCKTLCPGQWCTKGHCESHSGHCAYYCSAGKRPATCKLYKDYIAKKQKKEG